MENEKVELTTPVALNFYKGVKELFENNRDDYYDLVAWQQALTKALEDVNVELKTF